MSRSTHQALADERNATIEIYINGDFFPRNEAKISVFDSGFLVGDGIWEGIRLHHGVFAHLDRHLNRLFAGAAAIALDIGLDRDGIEAALRATVERNDMHDNNCFEDHYNNKCNRFKHKHNRIHKHNK